MDNLKNDIREQLKVSNRAVVELNRFNRACEEMYAGISLADKLRLFCEDDKWKFEVDMEDGEIFISKDRV